MGNLIKSCHIGSTSGKSKQQSPILEKGTLNHGSDAIYGESDEANKLISKNDSIISPKQQATADNQEVLSQSLLKDTLSTVTDEIKDECNLQGSSTRAATAAADSDILNTVSSSSCDVHVTYQSSVKQVYQRRKSTAALTGAIPPMDFPRIKLLPHEHTLFCERKQRVCTAVGKMQEMEVLKIDGFNLIPGGFTWIRIHPTISVGDNDVDSAMTMRCHSIDAIRSDSSLYSTIVDSDNLEQYVLTRDDVGCFIGVSYQISTQSTPVQIARTALSVNYPQCSNSLISNEANNIDGPQITRQFLLSEEYGLVLPGPPRLVEFTIEGGEPMEVGTYAMAKSDYIGGFEGASEYWWMRIGADGRRTQVTEPKKISVHPSSGRCLSCGGAGDQSLSTEYTSNRVDTSAADDVITSKDDDPRYYKLNEADRGCYLKAKCRPTRTDGMQGEIFTSKSSLIVS